MVYSSKNNGSLSEGDAWVVPFSLNELTDHTTRELNKVSFVRPLNLTENKFFGVSTTSGCSGKE